jgi:hypothetical protein
MTYRRYDMLTPLVRMILGPALIILGFFLMRPDFGERVWRVVMGVGIALVAAGIVSLVFSTRQDVYLDCAHCGGTVIPRVGQARAICILPQQKGSKT